jgi:hypothetical protein
VDALRINDELREAVREAHDLTEKLKRTTKAARRATDEHGAALKELQDRDSP